MTRRDFIALLGGATTWPVAARALFVGRRKERCHKRTPMRERTPTKIMLLG
jgi:hypothetical protein